MRRSAPRPLADALAGIRRDAAPQTVLARVQGCWAEVVGPAIAAEAQPVSERDGTLVVACRSATWSSELELLAPDLLDRLNEALGGGGGAPIAALRAKVRRVP